MVTIQVSIGDAVSKLMARAKKAKGSLKARLEALIDSLIELAEALDTATAGPHTELDLERLLGELAALLEAIDASAEDELTDAVEARLSVAEATVGDILKKLGRRHGPK